MVFRAQVMTGATPLAGATVALSITGPEMQSLTTAASSSQGIAEAKWATKAPAKRSTGTKSGTYTVTVTNVTAPGYTWDGVTSSAQATFIINAR